VAPTPLTFSLFTWGAVVANSPPRAAAPLFILALVTASILAGELSWNSESTRTSIERYVKKINHLILTAGLADSTACA